MFYIVVGHANLDMCTRTYWSNNWYVDLLAPRRNVNSTIKHRCVVSHGMRLPVLARVSCFTTGVGGCSGEWNSKWIDHEHVWTADTVGSDINPKLSASFVDATLLEHCPQWHLIKLSRVCNDSLTDSEYASVGRLMEYNIIKCFFHRVHIVVIGQRTWYLIEVFSNDWRLNILMRLITWIFLWISIKFWKGY